MTDAEKFAFGLGFSAAWDERVLNKGAFNPYNTDTESKLAEFWQRGYDSYMESLL